VVPGHADAVQPMSPQVTELPVEIERLATQRIAA
jgi:hypothetical protein